MAKITIPPMGRVRVNVGRGQPPPAQPPRRWRDGGPRPGSNLRKGKLRGPLAYRSSAGAEVDLYFGTPGSERVSGQKVRAYDWHLLPGESLDAGVTVTVAFSGGFWYVISAGCKPDANLVAPGGGGGGGAGGGSSGSTTTTVAQPATSNVAAMYPPTTMAFSWN